MSVSEYSDGDYLYGVDLDNIVESAGKNGVLTGLGVTENTPTPDMNVVVAAGTAFAGETKAVKGTGTTVPITAAHASLDRLDIIVINSSATISAVAGTPATTPNPPDLPDNSILLAIVEVDATVTQIFNADIIGRHLLVGSIQEEMIGAGEIKNTHINAGAAIAWSKIAVDGNVTYDDVAEIITAAWTIRGIPLNFHDGTIDCGDVFANGSYLVVRNGLGQNIFTFAGDGMDSTRLKAYGAYNIELIAVDGDIRLDTDGDVIMDAGGDIILTGAGTNVINVIYQTNGTSGGPQPETPGTGSIGITNAWYEVRACALSDVCSEIPIPKRALETLDSLMLTDVGAKIRDEKGAHVLKSEKLPRFLREDDRPAVPDRPEIPPLLDEEGKEVRPGKPARPGQPAQEGHMRNVTATISFLQGCVFELLQENKQLKARMDAYENA